MRNAVNISNPISQVEYHPFGTTSYRSGKNELDVSLKRYKYVGKERDEETGLYYYGARYYAGWLGRWISTDPQKEKYLNLSPYCYCANNPVVYIDPDGKDIDGVTYNKKTKKITCSDSAIARGTDKYIDARMMTKSGVRGVMKMIKSKETFYLHVTDKPMFVREVVNEEVRYKQIGGIAEENNIYISTYNFDKQLKKHDYSNSMLINLDGGFTIININPSDVYVSLGLGKGNDAYDRAYRKSGLKKFESNPENRFKSVVQFIHGIGAHEETHLFQPPSRDKKTFYKNEKGAMLQEIYERKQFIKILNK